MFIIGKTKAMVRVIVIFRKKETEGMGGGSDVLVRFYFLIHVLIIQMHLYCKNLGDGLQK